MSESRGRRSFDDLGARLARRILPRTPDFAARLHEQSLLSASTLEALSAYCRSADDDLAEQIARIEKDGDRLRERNVIALARAFSTDFDRAQIVVAIHRIDEVANDAKTTVRELGALGLEPDEHMASMAAELAEGGRALVRATAALRADPESVVRHVRDVRAQERRIEKQYRAAVAMRFPTDPEVIRMEAASEDPADLVASVYEAVRRREVYRHLSNTADRLERAGHVIREIALATI